MPEQTPITLPAVLTVSQLAEFLGQPVTAVIGKLMGFGVLATINEDIDFDTAAIVADDFGVEVVRQVTAGPVSSVVIAEGVDLENRPPVVTIMGHVDHGKTTLLDTIRKTSVAAGEAGGITQHISSYQIEISPKQGGEKRLITFLDTPGHSAFEAMRRHGAQITDLVVLVVAADDGVKPQTVEAINHAKAMKVPLMVAINKIDKPDADIERVKGELAEHDLVPEEWGGKTVVVPISAAKDTGIDDLLEVVLLSTDLRDLKANFKAPAVGVVIESHLQPGIGPVATLLIQNGTLRTGDYVALGEVTGKVRTLTDHRGKRLQAAGPSTPVEISGLSAVPNFGEQLAVFSTEKDSKESARQFSRGITAKRAISALSASAAQGTQKEGQKNILNLIVKADTNGSLEAIRDTLRTMKNDDVEVRVVSDGVGDISEGDVTTAVASRAIIVGFQVRLPAVIKLLADREHIPVTLYSVVYELFDSIREVLTGLMPMITIEKTLGTLKVLARFRDNRKNVVLGGSVESGSLSPKQLARVVRGKEVVSEGKVETVRRGKDEVRSVQAGSQCGIELTLAKSELEVAVNDEVVTFIREEERKSLGL
ncbi:MAG: translation initiation factor IF-2 [bacterium]